MFTRVVRGPQKVISDVVWRKILLDGSGIDKSRLLTMFRQLLYSAISCNSSKVIEAGERHALRTRNSPVDFARGQKFDQKPEGSDDIIGTSSFTMGRSFFFAAAVSRCNLCHLPLIAELKLSIVLPTLRLPLPVKIAKIYNLTKNVRNEVQRDVKVFCTI